MSTGSTTDFRTRRPELRHIAVVEGAMRTRGRHCRCTHVAATLHLRGYADCPQRVDRCGLADPWYASWAGSNLGGKRRPRQGHDVHPEHLVLALAGISSTRNVEVGDFNQRLDAGRSTLTQLRAALQWTGPHAKLTTSGLSHPQDAIADRLSLCGLPPVSESGGTRGL